VPAAQTALAVAHRPVLVTSDVTYTAELEITTASVTYQRLAAAGMPSWAQLLHAHLDRWVRDTGHRGSMMHDPLTLAVAAGVPLAETTQGRVVFDERGRMRLDPQGTDALYTQSGDYPRIRSWLDTHLLDRPEQLPGTQPGRKCSG
jgi:pyrimidine-specific ribonucleoside hydrolase